MPADRTRVALIFGGQSTEHQISCLTAAGVAKAIDTDRFEVFGIGISSGGVIDPATGNVTYANDMMPGWGGTHLGAELHAIFDDVFTIGEGSEEGSSLHRIYATFGVTYFFDRLFAQYARAFDPELKQE